MHNKLLYTLAPLATYTLLWAYKYMANQPTHCQASQRCRKRLNSSNPALDKTSDTRTFPLSFTMLVMDNKTHFLASSFELEYLNPHITPA